MLVDLGKQINDLLKLNQEIRRRKTVPKYGGIISDAISAGIAAGQAAALSL